MQDFLQKMELRNVQYVRETKNCSCSINSALPDFDASDNKSVWPKLMSKYKLKQINRKLKNTIKILNLVINVANEIKT